MSMSQDLWVFGYGSLMWKPGFDYVERQLATVHGYHRSLCVYSHVHRGSPDKPGLVLGLDRGGSCRGVAFRVPAAQRDQVIAYLREREQVTMIYREIILRARLADARQVEALVYVVDRSHHQYAGRLEREHVLDLVRQGVGVSGANPHYVLSTWEHLATAGIRDADLAWLAKRLQEQPPV
jgi:cation transport protein ChaC